MIFDSHAHYYAAAFDQDRNELLRKMNREQEVTTIVCPAENMLSSVKCVELAEEYNQQKNKEPAEPVPRK